MNICFTATIKYTVDLDTEGHKAHGNIDITADNTGTNEMMNQNADFACQSFFNTVAFGVAGLLMQMEHFGMGTTGELSTQFMAVVQDHIEGGHIQEANMFG